MLNLSDPTLLKNRLFFCGEWQKGSDATMLMVSNPATQEKICELKGASASDTNNAISYAESKQKEWRVVSAKHRAQVLLNWHDLMLNNLDDLAAILTLEQGKPLAEAKAEVIYAASYLKWFSEEARRVYGDIIPSDDSSKRLMVIKQPIGVVAAITPWNFPCAMITRKVAPALAAGCAIVVKPAESTPLSALALAELAQRAGLPDGLVSIVVSNSPADIGKQLTDNPIVRKLSFTGSTKTGKYLAEQCTKTLKKTSMELGGNAPFIIFPDADLNLAVKGALNSKFRNAGQTCVCANRFIVHSTIHDKFVNLFAKEVNKLKMGNGFETDVTIGPLIDKNAVSRVNSLVQDASQKGAKIVLGGDDGGLGRCYYSPTIISRATSNMRVFSEEIFGPVAAISCFDEEAQAIELANATDTGLAAYLFTQDVSRIWRISEALESGIVGVNEGIISTEVAPFGGVKESGNGREGSKYGIDDYLEIKYICLGGLK